MSGLQCLIDHGLGDRRNIYHVLCGKDLDKDCLKLLQYIADKLPKDVTRTLLRQQTKESGDTVSVYVISVQLVFIRILHHLVAIAYGDQEAEFARRENIDRDLG